MNYYSCYQIKRYGYSVLDEPLQYITSCKLDIPFVIYLHTNYLKINSDHLTEYLNQRKLKEIIAHYLLLF